MTIKSEHHMSQAGMADPVLVETRKIHTTPSPDKHMVRERSLALLVKVFFLAQTSFSVGTSRFSCAHNCHRCASAPPSPVCLSSSSASASPVLSPGPR